MSTVYKYIVDFVAKNQQFVSAMNQNVDKIGDVEKKAKTAKEQLGGMMDGAGKKLLALGSFAAISAGATALVTNIIDVRKEFEKYQAVLTTSLGSSQKARIEMLMLQKFAAETPFALTELTGAFVKLTNYGLKPGLEDMRRYGDLASSVGKGFDQLAEAVADSVTGEYERLKEFGIKASAEGNKVTFTFKNQKTTVDNTADAIQKYILSLGDMKGVSGSMAAISQTLGGRISNLGDAWDGLMNTMGGGTSGIMINAISLMTSLLNTFDGAFKSVEQLKEAVNDQSIAGSISNAMKEIEVMKKSLMNNGMTEVDAQKKALELYYDSINQRIAETNKSRKVGSFELKQALINERNGVEEQYKALGKSNETTKTYANTVDGLNLSLKDYNEALKAINPNDRAALMAKLSLINGAEKQLEGIDKLKKAMKTMAEDEANSNRGMKLLMIPTARVTGNLQVKGNDKDKIFNTKAKLDIKDFTSNAEQFSWATDEMEKASKKAQDALDATASKVQTIAGAFSQGFQSIGESVVNGLGLAKDGLEGFVGGMAATAMQFIAMMLAKSLAAAIFTAEKMAMLTGPGAIFSTPILVANAISGVMGAFASIPKFADGGLAFGPTMGLMGEYPGASTNPEVIAPLSKLKAMIGGGSNQTIILQPSLEITGDRLRVMLNRVNGNVAKRT